MPGQLQLASETLSKAPTVCVGIQVNVVYKFGGSSVRDGERMKEVADIICSFPNNLPIVVLSAMGKVGGSSSSSSSTLHQHRTIGTSSSHANAFQQQLTSNSNRCSVRTALATN
jgi:aspartokinase